MEVISASDQFVAQAASIAEINSTAIPEMEAKAEAHRFASFDAISKHLTAEDLEEFSRHAKELGNGILELVGRIEKGETGKSITLKMGGSAGAAISYLVMHTTRSLGADPHHQLLRNSLLVSAVSGFEILFGRIARSILQINGAAFNESDYGFTLQQLTEFESLDDAREYLIERQVSKLLYESIDGWDKWLKRASGGLSMSDLPVDWTVIREGFARRNLIVHADGVVNQLYLGALKNLDSRRDWGVHAGEKLGVSDEYLAGFLQELMALGRMLSAGIGLKMHKSDQSAFVASLQTDTYRSIMSGHWRTAIALSEYSMRHDLPRSKMIRTQVRAWIARKSLFGIDDIRNEVESWDVSGLAAEFSHFRSVLLDDKESATRQIRKLIEDDKLTIFEIAIDPVYAGIREAFVNPSTDPSGDFGDQDEISGEGKGSE